MIGRIKDFLYRSLLGEKLFDCGTVISDDRGNRSGAEITMSLNRVKDGRAVVVGIKERKSGGASYTWTRINSAGELRQLRDACDRLELLLAGDYSDEEIKALDNRFPELPPAGSAQAASQPS